MTKSQALNQPVIELRTHLADLLDALPDGVIVVDAHGRIILANARMEDLSGFNRPI